MDKYTDTGRRKALTAITGTTLGTWMAPVVTAVTLPAHAQTTVTTAPPTTTSGPATTTLAPACMPTALNLPGRTFPGCVDNSGRAVVAHFEEVSPGCYQAVAGPGADQFRAVIASTPSQSMGMFTQRLRVQGGPGENFDYEDMQGICNVVGSPSTRDISGSVVDPGGTTWNIMANLDSNASAIDVNVTLTPN